MSELDGTDGRGLGSSGARVAQAVERWGEGDVVRGCGRLLGLRTAPAGDDAELAMVLGGVSEPTWLAGGKPPGHAYWARVWAARALLYVWDAVAAEAIVTALEDPQWRVREMATKVITRREVPAADDMVGLVDDPLACTRGGCPGAGRRRRGRAFPCARDHGGGHGRKGRPRGGYGA